MNYTKAFTHGGKFHADDVFGAALLRILQPDIKFYRGNLVPENFDGLVFDIGFGEFDHHQRNSQRRENGVPYASFGLLWKTYGNTILCEEDAENFDFHFIQSLDLADCEGAYNELARVIADFNPDWDDKTASETAFENAVEFARGILERRFAHIRADRKAFDKVKSLIATAEDDILILNPAMPWKAALRGTDILFVIFPSARGGYMVQSVPSDEDELIPKCSFPKEWCGLSDEQLEKESGIKGLSFCHKGGFLCAADSEETAKKAARAAMNGIFLY